MKKFIVSKSDTSKIHFIQKAIENISPKNVFVLAEKERIHLFEGIGAVTLPLKELNKAHNWITFENEFDRRRSLLVVDNVLKFMFFGDGKKEYIKDRVQAYDNVIVMDVVPFYSEPAEIFYPFWFLGKGILGYNSYNTFKANHLEEKEDGSINLSHSFDVLYNKIKDFYVQDYPDFFTSSTMVHFEMNALEIAAYEAQKEKAKADFTNPVKFYNDISPLINTCQSRYDAINNLLLKLNCNKTVLVNNAASFQPLHRKKIPYLVDYLTFHSELSEFDKYDNVVFMQMPIAKPMNFYYIMQKAKQFYQIALKDNKLEDYYKDKIYNNELRKQIDTAFYHADLSAKTISI